MTDTRDYRQSVLLAGTGRSGTTWVQEIVNYKNEFRVMFEPFHSQKMALLKNWKYKQYLREDNTDKMYLVPTATILGGSLRHEWIDKFDRNPAASKRIIKEIRANLLLKWIKRHFPEIPIILLLRHPCAVANSRLKLNWNCHLENFLSQQDLISDFLEPFQGQITRAADLFEKNIFQWCIENFIPLRQFSDGEILVVFYEHLCTNPKEEVERIMSFLGEPFSGSIDELKLTAKPSALVRRDSAVVEGTDLIDSWRKHVSRKQLARVQEICGMFGMQAIYGESSLPLVDGKEALRALSG